MSLSRLDLANALLVTAILSLLLSSKWVLIVNCSPTGRISGPSMAEKIKCFQCTNRNQQCYESFACEGDYCVSQYSGTIRCRLCKNTDNIHVDISVRNNNEMYFTKYCENAAEGVPVKIGCRGSAEKAQETCYCNDQDFCNSSPHSTALRFFVLLTALMSTITVVHSLWL